VFFFFFHLKIIIINYKSNIERIWNNPPMSRF